MIIFVPLTVCIKNTIEADVQNVQCYNYCFPVLKPCVLHRFIPFPSFCLQQLKGEKTTANKAVAVLEDYFCNAPVSRKKKGTGRESILLLADEVRGNL